MNTENKKTPFVNIYIPVKNVYINEEKQYAIVNLDKTSSFIISKKFVHTTKKGINFSIGLKNEWEYNATFSGERQKIYGKNLVDIYFENKKNN